LWAKENVPTPKNVPDHPSPPFVCDGNEASCSTVLYSIACVSQSACYLAGGVNFALGGSSGLEISAPIAAFWDGSRWRGERVPDVGVPPNNATAGPLSPIYEDDTYGTHLNELDDPANPGHRPVQRRVLHVGRRVHRSRGEPDVSGCGRDPG
jgi:hypothetical protein